MSLERLKKSLEKAKVMRRGKYKYFIHPLTDSIPPIEPALLKQVCEKIIQVADLDSDYILTMEAMGIHVSTLTGYLADLPVNIIRKRPYGLEGEVQLKQETGYGRSKMYLNNVEKGDIVTVIDAVISTGSTLTATLDALVEKGAIVKDVICVIERGGGVKKVAENTGFHVKTLAKIEVGEKVKILSLID